MLRRVWLLMPLMPMPIHSGETNKKSRLLICNHPTKRVPPSPLSKYWQALVVVNFISYLLSHLKMSWQLCISINSFGGFSFIIYHQQQHSRKRIQSAWCCRSNENKISINKLNLVAAPKMPLGLRHIAVTTETFFLFFAHSFLELLS